MVDEKPPRPGRKTGTSGPPAVVGPGPGAGPAGVDETGEPAWEDLFGAVETSEIAFATEESYQKALQSGRQEDQHRQLLSFTVGGEPYGLDLELVKEILKYRPVTPVPRTRSFVEGVISVRGVVMPVMDLGLRLGLGATLITRRARILVVAHEENRFGLTVESVTGVERTGHLRVEPPPGVMTPAEAEFVEGIGRFGNQMLILLRLEAILDFEAVTLGDEMRR